MQHAVIAATGLFTPEQSVSNAELVDSYNAWADGWNARHADRIEAGELEAKPHSSPEFIEKASGIKQRFVMDKAGVIDPARMAPNLPERSNEELSILAEMAVKAARQAIEAWGKPVIEIGAVLCAASNMQRPYPAMAIEVQQALGIEGFAFDMNVACSSATFGIQAAADMIRGGSARRALVVSPEICSGHLEWRDRDCHFIFGDVCTAVLIEAVEEAKGPHFVIRSTRCATQFSNNIRNNNGFLRRTRPDGLADRRDMQFVQEGRKVFKEVLPMVSAHILAHLEAEGVVPDELRRLWLHQANKAMNDFIGRKVLGRVPEPEEQPNILQDYANTSSAGSIIAFSQYSDDLRPGDQGLICSFGAGYSVGSVLVERG